DQQVVAQIAGAVVGRQPRGGKLGDLLIRRPRQVRLFGVLVLFREQPLESIKRGHVVTFQLRTGDENVGCRGSASSGRNGQEFGFVDEQLQVNFLPRTTL